MKNLLLLLFLVVFVFYSHAQTDPAGASETPTLWIKANSGVTGTGTLTWLDQSGNLNNLVQDTAANQPLTNDRLFNFNPTLTFDGTDDYFAITSLNYASGATLSSVHAFVVFATPVSGAGGNDNWAFLDFDRSEVYNFYIDGNNGRLEMAYKTATDGVIDVTSAPTAANNDKPHIGTYIFDSSQTNESIIRLDGKEDSATDKTAEVITANSTRYGFVGDGSEAPSFDNKRNEAHYEGEIAEVILFDSALITAADINQIESYLALKYGVSLDPSSTQYVDASGATIWDDATYWNNVMGLINDTTNGTLKQRVTSSTTGNLVLSRVSTDFTTDNANILRNAGELAVGESILVGDNGETGFETTSTAGVNRLKTTWRFRVNDTGSGSISGTTSIGIPKSLFPDGEVVNMRLKNGDDDFDSGTVSEDPMIESGDYLYADVELDDDDYITFETEDVLIAGISVTRFDILLRADQGLDTSSGFNLTDGSANGVDAAQSSADRIPLSSNLMNFNPTLTFDGVDDYLFLRSKNYVEDDEINNLHVFAVFQTEFSEASDPLDNTTDNFRNWAFLDFDRSESFNTFIYPTGQLAFSYNNSSGGTKDAFSESLGNDNIPHIAEFIFDNRIDAETFMIFDGEEEYNEDRANNTGGGLGGADRQPITVRDTRYGFIGDGSEATSENGGRNNKYYQGNISEILLADRVGFSATEILQIESYLGLKYGVNLNPTIGQYLDSQGLTIWNNTTYWNGVAGLIKDDDDSDLDQRVAQSTSAQDIIIALDDNYTSSNVSRSVYGFDEGYSLLFGNNGAGRGYLLYDDSPDPSEYISARKWYFDEKTTGVSDIGNVFLGILKTEANSFFPETADNIVLLRVNGTDDFSSPEVIIPLTTVGDDDYYRFELDLDDGDRIAFRFTLPSIPSPGGISTGLTMWIKGDKNVSSAASLVSSIGDSSISGNDVAQNITNLEKPQDSIVINYNTGINFDGVNDDFSVQNLNYTTAGEISKLYAWVVYENSLTASGNNQSFLSFDDEQFFELSVDSAGALDFSYTISGEASVTTVNGDAPSTNGTTNMVGFSFDDPLGGTSYESNIRLNGTANTAATAETAAIGATATTRFGYVGAGSEAPTQGGATSGDFYDGKIAEIVYYEGETVSSTDIDKIESYLALKYGVTKFGNYIDSDETVIWDATANSSYSNNIFGIGQDDASELNQKQSIATGGSRYLTVSLAGAIAENNKDITEEFSDGVKEFLILGNNAAVDALSLQAFGSPSGTPCSQVFKSLDRIWKVSHTGSVGAVTLSFDLSSVPIPAAGYTLMENNTGDDVVANFVDSGITGTLTGSTLVFTGVTLTDGYTYTLRTSEEVDLVIYQSGNWSGGDGVNEALTNTASNESVFMYDDYTFEEDVNCTCLSSSAGVKLSVAEDKILTVTDILANEGPIFLFDDAQLVQTSAGSNSNTGTGSVYQVLTELKDTGFQYNFVSSPVNTSGSFTINSLKFNTDETNLETNTDASFTDADSDGYGTTLSKRMLYAANNQTTSFTKIDETTALIPGQGFTMKGTGQENRYNFIGIPNNGEISTGLSITADNFFLVGNPYPSAINADEFNTTNDGITDGTIYFWNHLGGTYHNYTPEEAGYSTRAGGVGAKGTATDAVEPTAVIRPGQGFIVTGANGGAGGDIIFNNAMREPSVSIDGAMFFKNKKKSSSAKPVIRLGFEFETNDNKTFHRQLVTVPSGGTLGFDAGKDARMFDNNNNDAYLQIEDSNRRYVITSVPSVSEDLEINIGVASDNDKQVTFTLDGVESFDNKIYLLDKELRTITNIREDNYTTRVASGDTKSRFSLVFKEDIVFSSEADNAVIYANGDSLHIILDSGALVNVKIYDFKGRELLNYNNNNGSSSAEIDVHTIVDNLVVLRVVTDEGTFTRKVLLD